MSQSATTTNTIRRVSYELPAPSKTVSEQILHRTAYTVSYNKNTRNPNWVAWHLTAEHVKNTHSRDGIRFEEDLEVPAPRATNMDYVQSGYDRGHMCPSGDNRWDSKVQHESFKYSNCCPQRHSMNSGGWNDLEVKCREWAKKYGDVWIACGPIYDRANQQTIGKNRVAVPAKFFKAILTRTRNGGYKAIGFIYPNKGACRNMSNYACSVDELERVTGYDFFASLPDKEEDKAEAMKFFDKW